VLTITIRPYRGGPLHEYDIRVSLPGFRPFRERRCTPYTTEREARAWADARAVEILDEIRMPEAAAVRPPAPTLAEFAPRWVETYAIVKKRQKPSEVESKRSIIRTHLIPWRGDVPMDQLTPKDGLALELSLAKHAPKTANNVYAVLRRMFRSAVEWGELERMPFAPESIKVPRKQDRPFYEFDELKALLEAKADPRGRLIVLLGADAGARMGEMRELRFTDVNHRTGLLTLARAVWREDEVGPPKGGLVARLQMTSRLALELKAQKHLKGGLVLCHPDGSRLSVQTTRSLFGAVCRLAGVDDRGIHALRHTFCSHLAMRGALPKEIQELARHQHIETTMGYMHLSPDRPAAAIRLLEGGDVEKSGRQA